MRAQGARPTRSAHRIPDPRSTNSYEEEAVFILPTAKLHPLGTWENQLTTCVDLLSTEQTDRLLERAREMVEYRKSGLNLNHLLRLSASNPCQITPTNRPGTVPGD